MFWNYLWAIGRNPLRAIGNDYNEKSNHEIGESVAGYCVPCTGREVGTADSPASRCVEELLCEAGVECILNILTRVCRLTELLSKIPYCTYVLCNALFTLA